MQNLPSPVAMTIEADSFTGMLAQMRDVLRNRDGHPVYVFSTRIGDMDVEYDHDDDGIFARLVFLLPEGVLVEVEGETYAQQEAYRVYITEHNAEVISEHGYGVSLGADSAIEVRSADGNHVEDIAPGDNNYGDMFAIVITGNR